MEKLQYVPEINALIIACEMMPSFHESNDGLGCERKTEFKLFCFRNDIIRDPWQRWQEGNNDCVSGVQPGPIKGWNRGKYSVSR